MPNAKHAEENTPKRPEFFEPLPCEEEKRKNNKETNEREKALKPK